MFRPEDCAELLLRLRPIGLALRATPAAPSRKGNIFFMAQPPLLCAEGNLLSDAGLFRRKFGYVKYVDALNEEGISPLDGTIRCWHHAVVSAASGANQDQRKPETKTLGDLLYPNKDKVPVSEKQWVGLVQSIAA